MSELVSVIIPVYNMENSIESCVECIQKQDYSNIEIILVDDGSKDKSFEKCKGIAKKDSRVKCIHTENQGSGPARNTGIMESKGRYLYFPDADDFLEPQAISVLVAATCHGLYDLIVFGYKCVSHDGVYVSDKKYEPFTNSGEAIRADYSAYFGMSPRFGIQGAPWNKFFDGDIVRKNSIEYPPLRRHQDEGFISRYMCHCKNARFIPDVLYTYYPNTVGMEWKKYPVNYVDCAIGLCKIWKETICTWSPEDALTHKLVDKEYFTKVIKSLELSYSPKMKLSFMTRPGCVKRICKKSGFSKYSLEVAGSSYQKILLLSSKLHFYFFMTLILYVGNMKNHMRQGK